MSSSSISESLIQRHPLQRIASPSRTFSAIVHLSGLLSFAAAFKYLLDYPSIVNESYGWHFQYLTIIGLTLATATFLLGLAADVTLSPRLFLAKNALAVTSAPLEVLISILYWGLSVIDKRLVVPEWAVLDPWADIGFHAAPALFLLLDILFLSPPWTITVLPSVAVSSVLALVYWAWIEQCYKQNGWYPYPIFEALSLPYRAALFGVSGLTMAASTSTLKWLYGRINGYGDGSVPRARPGAVKES